VRRFAHYLDGFREFPGWPGLPEQEPRPAELPAFLDAIKAEGFDLVVQLHGGGALTNPLTALFGGRAHAGYYVPGQPRPDPERFLPYPADLPEVRRHLRLMEHPGVPLQGEDLDFPPTGADCEALAAAEEAAAAGVDGYGWGSFRGGEARQKAPSRWSFGSFHSNRQPRSSVFLSLRCGRTDRPSRPVKLRKVGALFLKCAEAGVRLPELERLDKVSLRIPAVTPDADAQFEHLFGGQRAVFVPLAAETVQEAPRDLCLGCEAPRRIPRPARPPLHALPVCAVRFNPSILGNEAGDSRERYSIAVIEAIARIIELLDRYAIHSSIS